MTDKAISKIDNGDQAVLLPADPMVSMIERVAMDPGADLEKLQRMLEMKERMDDRAREDQAREAKRLFFAALAAAQSAVPIVLKNRSNTQTNSKYADLAAIEAQAMPVIRENGFSISAWSIPGATDGYQRVRFRVAHADGHSDEIEDDFPLDLAGIKGTVNKTQLHAKQSTVNYARRNLLCGYFNIATSDDDGNSGGGSVAVSVSAEQFVTLRDLIEQTNTDLVKFFTAHGAKNPESETLEQFPAAMFETAKGQLERKLASMSNV